MTRERARDKGRRLLAEGRLTVKQVGRAGVLATCRGDSGLTYRCEWSPYTGWRCNCEAVTDQCSHLVALRLVVVVGGDS